MTWTREKVASSDGSVRTIYWSLHDAAGHLTGRCGLCSCCPNRVLAWKLGLPHHSRYFPSTAQARRWLAET